VDEKPQMHRCCKISSHLVGGNVDAPRQTILITGCTSGLGEHLCREFAQLGHQVVGCARRAHRIQKLQESLGDRHFFSVCDASSLVSVNQLKDVLHNRGIEIDILINNAGTYAGGKLAWEVEESEFERCMQINVNGGSGIL